MASFFKPLPSARFLSEAERSVAAASVRDNHFDLLRLAMAMLVVVSHAFEFVGGGRDAEPLYILSGGYVSLGELGVYGFFSISGYLIARSWRRQPALGAFLIARALRIMPALIALVTILAFVIGPAVTVLPLQRYFTDPAFLSFLAHYGLIADYRALPGVYDGHAVAAPLWTLGFEAFCYLLIAGLGALRLLSARVCLGAAVTMITVGLAAPDGPLHFFLTRLGVVGPCFVAGAWCALSSERVLLDKRLAWLAVAVSAVALSIGWLGQLIFFTGTYLAIYLAYAQWRAPAWIKRLPDISYGVYIWGWPLQLIVQRSVDPTNVLAHLVITAPMIVGVAYLSWRFVESPALKLKGRAIAPPVSRLRKVSD